MLMAINGDKDEIRSFQRMVRDSCERRTEERRESLLRCGGGSKVRLVAVIATVESPGSRGYHIIDHR